MKTTIYLLCLLLAASQAIAQPGWNYQNPYPTRADLFSVKFQSPHEWFIMGDAGTLMKSTNEGVNWVSLNSNTTEKLHSMCNSGTNTCFIAGEKGTVIRSTNSGANWTVLNTGTLESFYCMDFINENTGYAAGDFGTLVKTTNAGASWTLEYINSIFFIKSIQFTTENIGFLCAGDQIFKTTNSGNNWTALAINTTSAINSLFFTDENNGYAGGDGIFLKTTNAGLNWSVQSQSGTITSIHFADANNGCYVTSYGIYLTTNAGSNWTLSSQTYGLNSVWMNNKDIALAVGTDGVIYGMSDGQNWVAKSRDLVGYVPLYSVSFPSSNVGYTAGYRKILKTTDEGQNWQQLSLSTAYIYKFVCFIDENTGYVIGDSLYTSRSSIFKTTNGGVNWTSRYFPSIELKSIHFTNSTTGYASGIDRVAVNTGVVYKTIDAGNNWSQIYTDPLDYYGFNSLCFSDANTGFVSGYGGYIHRTTNAGLTWSKNQFSSSTFNSIHFPSRDTGFAAGAGGSLYWTRNAGVSWARRLFVYGDVTFNSIRFSSVSTGYCAGSAGTILKTTNSGLNWTKQFSRTSNILYSVFFLNSDHGYTVGELGIILNTVNGGNPVSVSTISSLIPEGYFISQNFPNPFNPTTRIKYHLPKSGKVEIRLYDIIGREAGLLVNDYQAAGIYEVEFNGSGYTSGVYFYKLVVSPSNPLASGNFSDTKRMLLIK